MKCLLLDDIDIDKKEHFYSGESCELYRDIKYVYKIYDDALHPWTVDKIKKVGLVKDLKIELGPHFVLPQKFIINKDNVYTGYLTKNMTRCHNLSSYQVNNSNDIKRLCLILKELDILIRKAHQLGIVFGDLHFDNVLVNHKNKPFLIDFDSIKIAFMNSYTISRLLSSFLKNNNLNINGICIGINTDNLSILLSILYMFVGDDLFNLDKVSDDKLVMSIPFLQEIVDILKEVNKRKEIPSIPYVSELSLIKKRP